MTPNSRASPQDTADATRCVTEESCYDILRRLREARKNNKHEVLSNKIKPTTTKKQALLEERITREEQLEAQYASQINELEEEVQKIRQENVKLRGELDKASGQASLVPDLKKQASKWKTRYFESAKTGAEKLQNLEAELKQMEEAHEKARGRAESANKQIAAIKAKLQLTWALEDKKAVETRIIQTDSQTRMDLQEMFDNSQEENTSEVQIGCSQRDGDKNQLDYVSQLKYQLIEKEAELEREIKEAAERERILQEQHDHIEKLKYQLIEKDAELEVELRDAAEREEMLQQELDIARQLVGELFAVESEDSYDILLEIYSTINDQCCFCLNC